MTTMAIIKKGLVLALILMCLLDSTKFLNMPFGKKIKQNIKIRHGVYLKN